MPLKRLLIPLTAALAVLALAAPAAFASTHQVSLVLDNNALNKNPETTLLKLKSMGVTMVKYAVYWNEYAVDPNSARVSAADKTPAAYLTHEQFGLLDEIDTDAAKLGIKVGLMVTSPAPRWAEGTSGCTRINIAVGSCRPSTADYEDFIKALGERYSGTFKLDGVALPAVTWWSVWNEPNYSPNLTPQVVGSSTYEAGNLYRGLVDAAWAGLKATGHARDTFIFGELAPRGISNIKPADGGGTKPVQFLASMYCVTTSGRRLTGRTAAENDCPSSASAFKRDNPALFDATGVADHPYAQGTAPDVPTYDCVLPGLQAWACQNANTKETDPLWTDLASISHLENGLTTDLRAYGSGKKFQIWNTEYGYWTTPSQYDCHSANEADCATSAATAAYYDNWAEYISYENPRIVSFAQYQLYEPTTGNWTDGLLSKNGTPRPAYDAFEVPFFMPTTDVARAGNLKVWGVARPAAYYYQTHGIKPLIEIQFKGKSGGWKTLKTVDSDSYFTTYARFTSSGSVRLVYDIGKYGSLTSRTQAITVK